MEIEYLGNAGVIHISRFATVLDALAFIERNGYALLKGDYDGQGKSNGLVRQAN